MEQPILMVYGSKREIWRKEVPLWGQNDLQLNLCAWAQTPPIFSRKDVNTKL